MDTDVRLMTPTTRRTIVRTGAKVAYAAPLVAASVRVTPQWAAAQGISGSFCGHSSGINGGCMGACQAGRWHFTAQQCGVICGTAQSAGACPMGQGRDNPCCNREYCVTTNFLLDSDTGDPVYFGLTWGCPA